MREPEPQRSPFGYLVSAAVNGALLWAAHRLLVWKPFFLLDSYPQALWAIDVSLIVQITLNVVLAFFHPLFFHHLAQAALSLVGLLPIAVLLRVFPVDFSVRLGHWANTLFRIVLIVGLAGSVLGGVIHFVRFLRSLFHREALR